ncbi:hypothetical protein MAR_030711 [Mya arenaria]|uniref:Tyrosine-protein phosphatase domain-containing protein n=1 Tax=Mya arenaria TaxID=6604 RepID=A0ABY7F1N6_MYAAR|nr:hypothetical protein MAR_030711 [Mya arenaria]
MKSLLLDETSLRKERTEVEQIFQDIGEYYPADNQELKKGQLTISCGRDKVTNEYNIQKWLTIEFKGSTQSEGGKSTLRHFEFTDWNQTGNVPSSLANYVAFLRDAQFDFCHDCVLEFVRSFKTYSNFSEDI